MAPGGESCTRIVLAVALAVVMIVPTGALASVRDSTLAPHHGTPPQESETPKGESVVSPASGVGKVNGTLCLWNDTLWSGNQPGKCNNGYQPVAAVYDPANGDVYVINQITDNVEVISGSTNTVVAMIPVGFYPSAATYDPANQEVYVTDEYSNNVSVVNGSTNTVVATIPVGAYPAGVAYDSGNGDLYVTDSDCYLGPCGLGNVSVINGTTGTVVATIPVGSQPTGVAYDPATGNLYVTDFSSLNVSVVSSTTNKVVATVDVGDGPYSAAYDSANAYIYVANYDSADVGVLNGSTNTLVTSIKVGNSPASTPTGVTYDSLNHDVYATNSHCQLGPICLLGNVSVISGATNIVLATVPVGMGPWGMVFDTTDGEIYVANAYSSNVSVISGSTNRVVATVPMGTYPSGAVYDSTNGDVYVTDSGSNAVSVVSGSSDRVVTTIPVGTEPWGAAFDPANGDIYIANVGSDNVSVVNGSTNAVNSTIPLGSAPDGAAYDSANGNIYFMSYNSTNVSVISGSTNKVVASVSLGHRSTIGLSNGIVYDSADEELYAVDGIVSVINGTTDKVAGTVQGVNGATSGTYDPVDGKFYFINGNSNNVSVVSGALNKVVATIPVGNSPEGPVYDSANNAIFVANTGSNDVSVISGVTNTVVTTISVVTLPWSGEAFDEISGDVLVFCYDRGDLSIIGPFTLPTSYTVSFNETGLPVGSTWSVGLNGTTNSSTADTIRFTELNGTYNYTVSGPAGYRVNPSSGTVTVAGKAISQILTFTKTSGPTRYSVSFIESGLPSGTTWSVTFNGTTSASNSSSIAFGNLVNNTTRYAFTVGAVTGYTSSPSSGSVVVIGGNVTKPITFTKFSTSPTKYWATFTESGLPIGTNWSVTLNGTPERSDTSGITFSSLLNNTTGYAFMVGAVTGYTSNPSSGSIVVNGGNVTKEVAFTAVPTLASVGISPSSITVLVNATQEFNATPSCNGGSCPKGVAYAWTLNHNLGSLNSSTGASTSFTAGSNSGTATLSVKAALNGKFAWANATVSIIVPTLEDVTIIPPAHFGGGFFVGRNATFVAKASCTGGICPSNVAYQWTLRTLLGSGTLGSLNSTTGSVVRFTGGPDGGEVNLTVNASMSGIQVNSSIPIVVTIPSFRVYFTESGLPESTSWSVTIHSNYSLWSNDSLITFDLYNGTYSYTVHAPSGYSAKPASGLVTVAGGLTPQTNITFTKVTSSPIPTFLGLPGYEGYILIGVVVALVAAVVAVVILRKRKEKDHPAASPPPPAGPPPTP